MTDEIKVEVEGIVSGEAVMTEAELKAKVEAEAKAKACEAEGA